MHTPGFLCLGLFNTSINNHIPQLFQGWAVSVAKPSQLPSSNSQDPYNIFFQASPTLQLVIPGTALLLPAWYRSGAGRNKKNVERLGRKTGRGQ